MYPQGRYNPFAGVPQVDARTAHRQLGSGEAGILDVREPTEWELGHIDGANWIPLGDLPMRWRELDAGRKWICVCLAGTRSAYAATLLRQEGIDAANLTGGMLEWQSEQLPITPPGIVATH